jgi:hypothetical protein
MPVDILLSDGPEPPVEFVHTVEFLRRLPFDDLSLARQLLLHQFGGVDPATRHRRIALIGLRGQASRPWGPRSLSALQCHFWNWIV